MFWSEIEKRPNALKFSNDMDDILTAFKVVIFANYLEGSSDYDGAALLETLQNVLYARNIV